MTSNKSMDEGQRRARTSVADYKRCALSDRRTLGISHALDVKGRMLASTVSYSYTTENNWALRKITRGPILCQRSPHRKGASVTGSAACWPQLATNLISAERQGGRVTLDSRAVLRFPLPSETRVREWGQGGERGFRKTCHGYRMSSLHTHRAGEGQRLERATSRIGLWRYLRRGSTVWKLIPLTPVDQTERRKTGSRIKTTVRKRPGDSVGNRRFLLAVNQK